jgi:hypothetical protein
MRTFPAGQDVQVVEAGPEYSPVPQSTHVASLVAPVDKLYLPSPQFTHEEAPVEGLYFPLSQSTHVASLVAPVDVLYFPSPQASQSELEAPPVGL